MVLDSSAIIALVLGEPEAPRLRARIESASIVLVGAPTALETSMVLTRFIGEGARELMEELFTAAEIETVPFDSAHAVTAHDAFLRFGKGRHTAALNYGDCMAYAMARVSGHPLLFAGSDFSQTDIPSAD